MQPGTEMNQHLNQEIWFQTVAFNVNITLTLRLEVVSECALH